MATVFELQEKRASLVHDMRQLLDTAEAEERDLTAEETGQYERMEADVESADEQITDLQEKQRQERKQRLEQYESAGSRIRNRTPRPQISHEGEQRQRKVNFMKDLEAALWTGENRRNHLDSIIMDCQDDEDARQRHQDFISYLQTGEVSPALREYSALQMDSDTAGGSMIADEMFLARFIRGLDERVFMRQISTILPMVNAHSVGIAAEGADPADADWTGELLTGTLDTTMTTGKRTLRPRDVAKRILVSKRLLRHSAAAEAFVRERMLFKMAITQEKAFLTGSGANQPLGVFTASADGISTGQDVNTDNTTTDVTADGLMNALYNLAEQYLRSANLRWIFHRLVIRNIRKLKDGNGQYLWNPGLGGEPNTLLDVPVIMSEFAPNTFTTGLYVGIVGDFSYYYIAESLGVSIQRLTELHAATNQDGFYTRAEVDGMPVLEEAFTRVTLA